jgi:two-component system cell cycle sensor histidine kinase/response regulator CckA
MPIESPQALEEQVRRLQKVDVLGQLAAGIAHDFNNILTAIIGYADLLETSSAATGEFRDDVAQIRRAAQRAASLTRQILTFTRSERPQPAIVDVNAIVGEMSSMLRRLVGEDVDVDVKCQSTSAPARIDIGQLEQVIMNLVVNARDAMPQGGRISIRTHTLTADSTHGTRHPDLVPGDYVALDVLDEGVGMDDETRTRLFEPFFTTKQAGRGTGLGLSIVFDIVRRSGGHIVVESSPGAGARFSVLLPLAGPAAGQQPRRPEDERRALTGRETVLLVEDDVEVRSLASLWLRRYGYDVHEAPSGEDALAEIVCKSLSPDLLITDLVMRHMGGSTLARCLLRARPTLKVLYVSGYAPPEGLHDHLAEPGVGFLAKPFSPCQLLNTVRRVLTWTGPDRRSPSGWRSLLPEDAAGHTARESSGLML